MTNIEIGLAIIAVVIIYKMIYEIILIRVYSFIIKLKAGGKLKAEDK